MRIGPGLAELRPSNSETVQHHTGKVRLHVSVRQFSQRIRNTMKPIIGYLAGLFHRCILGHGFGTRKPCQRAAGQGRISCVGLIFRNLSRRGRIIGLDELNYPLGGKLDFERGLIWWVVAGNKPKVLKRLVAHFHESVRVGREGKARKRWLCKFHALILRQAFETRNPLI